MMQPPTNITDEETFWVRSRDVSDHPAIGGDAYFETHDVVPWTETSETHLPPAPSQSVRRIDRDALEQETFIGKWQVLGSAARIEELWPQLIDDAEAGIIWAAKAMTETGYTELPYDEYMITVYTPNYFDTDDVWRVRAHLEEAHGVTRELYYKPDIYTAKGIVSATAEEFGLERPARYVG